MDIIAQGLALKANSRATFAKARVDLGGNAGWPTINARTTIVFVTNPTAGDTLTLNGTVVTFVASGATGTQCNIAASPQGVTNTATNLAAMINASADAQLSKIVAYANFRSITLAYRTPGTAGNGFTIATSNTTALRLDGATLVGGTTKSMPTTTLTKTSSSSISNSVSTLCSVAGAFRFTGPNVVDQGSSYAGSYVSTPSSTQLTVERISDASVIEFRTFGNNVSLMLFVDELDGFGEYPVQDHAGFITDASGAAYNLKVDWSGARRLRKYRLVGVNMPFRGVYEGPYDTGYAPADDAPVLVCLGDSYEQGVGSVTGMQPSAVMAKALGMRHYADGVGGSGWNTPGADDPGTRVANRLAPQDATTRVGLVVFSLGYNDAAGNMTTGAQHMQEAINAYRASAKLNAAPLIMMTPHTPLGTTAGLTNVKNTIISVAAANKVPVVDLENLFPTAAAGVLDLNDGVHPSAMVGSPVRGRFMAERALKQLLA